MWQLDSAEAAAPRDCRARAPTQDPLEQAPLLRCGCWRLGFCGCPPRRLAPPHRWPRLSGGSPAPRSASLPTPRHPGALRVRTPLVSTASSLTAGPRPSSSCSSPSWSRGTRPYFSPPSLVNPNPRFSNTFACLHLDGRIGSYTVWPACRLVPPEIGTHCVVSNTDSC